MEIGGAFSAALPRNRDSAPGLQIFRFSLVVTETSTAADVYLPPLRDRLSGAFLHFSALARFRQHRDRIN
jgi:hypothetical protein